MGAFEQVSWGEFLRHMQWRQGEHVTLIAPTQQGKTTLARELLKWRAYVMVLVTKKRDKTLTRFDGYRRMEYPAEWAQRVLVYPPFPRTPDTLFRAHRDVFRRALVLAYRQGGWTVYADEVWYLAKKLDLTDELELLWLQGASLGVSVVVSTQRPRYIPLLAYDQPTHLCLWRDTDLDNVRRLADIGGNIDRAAVMTRVPNLPRHRFIYVNTRTDTVLETQVPADIAQKKG